VGYDAWRHFFENAIRHCVADEAASIDFVQIDGFGDFGVGGRFTNGERFCCSDFSLGRNLHGKRVRYQCRNDTQRVGSGSYCAIIGQQMLPFQRVGDI
jgi:hypothetical protein